MAFHPVATEHNVHLLVSPTGASLPCRQSDAARVLVVHHLRGRDNTVPGLWEVHTIREVVQGRLAGIWMHDPALLSHGARTCHSALWDEQCDHDGAHGRGDLAPVDW